MSISDDLLFDVLVKQSPFSSNIVRPSRPSSLGLLAIAITYIVKQKKAGVKCIGCSASGSCSCHCDENILVKKFREDHGR